MKPTMSTPTIRVFRGFPVMKLLLALGLALYLAGGLAGAARAQQGKEPDLPPLLQTLRQEGGQVRYLGKANGLDGWITVKNGQEQYFYSTPDGQGLLMGLLFDKDGKMVTVRQVQALQAEAGDIMNMFVQGLPPKPEQDKATREFKTPAEQLFTDVGAANWIPLGKEGAPVIYSFIDTQCPHCHAFMKDIRKNYIDNGLVQVRMIPVGLNATTRNQGAVLLAIPDPQAQWYRFLDGDDKALPLAPGINEQGVERNMAILQSWKFDATPIIVYRAADGQVKIVQGRPRDVGALVRDLAGKS